MTSPVRRRRDKRLKQLKHQANLKQQQAKKPAATLHDWRSVNHADCHLIGKAVRKDWPVPSSVRPLILDGLFASLNGEDDRLAIAASRVLVSMAEVDQREQFKAFDELVSQEIAAQKVNHPIGEVSQVNQR